LNLPLLPELYHFGVNVMHRYNFVFTPIQRQALQMNKHFSSCWVEKGKHTNPEHLNAFTAVSVGTFPQAAQTFSNKSL
jgi:hypothetical protein